MKAETAFDHVETSLSKHKDLCDQLQQYPGYGKRSSHLGRAFAALKDSFCLLNSMFKQMKEKLLTVPNLAQIYHDAVEKRYALDTRFRSSY